ncbi:hypothetical protein LM13656_20033 [Listeria monocytogenes]|nr:hypothetical protein LM1000505_20033 [Listeria monocytogenes]CUK36791.1 hypothetical protein LM13656_20033 [Listeria monocytogenes]CUK45409.1 hypothetical protein LM500190_260002 [Listeria monocytogenes]CUK54415.1 hypothetical protein LM500704_30021 [Listeria monocytogenes]CUK54991.1 hypothetical protein LM600444_30032 [Listeria monocytogenes]
MTSIAIISSILFGLPFIGTDIYENQRSLTFKSRRSVFYFGLQNT